MIELVLPRLRSGLFRALFAMKEILKGKAIHKRASVIPPFLMGFIHRVRTH